MASNVNNLVKRYAPNSRFNGSTGFNSTVVCNPKYETFGKSITDKESYRLSLLGSANSGAMGVGFNSGNYAFPDGKYDPTKDISFVLRPDLSPVQIDEYLHDMQSALEKSDGELNEKIKSDMAKAQEVANSVAQQNKQTESSD